MRAYAPLPFSRRVIPRAAAMQRGGAGGGGSPDCSAPGDRPHPNPSPEGEGLSGFAPLVCCNGQVTVYARNIGDGEGDIAILDDAERARYDRFARRDDARRYLVGRTLLKTVLGDALSLAPHNVAVSIGHRDRPFVAGAPDFNLSHSGDWVVLALARAGRVGVDIEPLSREGEVRRIASRIATPEELAGFADHAALQVWCIKEAIAKAIGEGLHLDFRSITIDSRALPVIAGAQVRTWSIDRLRTIPGHLLVCAHQS